MLRNYVSFSRAKQPPVGAAGKAPGERDSKDKAGPLSAFQRQAVLMHRGISAHTLWLIVCTPRPAPGAHQHCSPLCRLELGGLGLAVAQRQGVNTVRELEVVRA